MRLFAFPSVIALAAAQGLLSLPPALQSFADGIQSLIDPSSGVRTTPTATPAATHSPETTASPAPAPPPVTTTSESSSIVPTSSSSVLTTTSTSPTSSPTISPTILSTNTPTTRSTTSTHPAESASSPTETSSSSTSSGLSHQAKVGVGVGVGVFVFVGLLAAALYSFVRDRQTSEAYAAWRERRYNKHGRLDSRTSHSSFSGGAEKVTELRRVEHGDGTFKTQVAPYSVPASSQSSQSLDRELPVPPPTYQQERQIKRKAVPGSTPQRPRFSWMD